MSPSVTVKKRKTSTGEERICHYYYLCNNKYGGDETLCTLGMMRAKPIEDLVIDEVRRLSKNEKVVRGLLGKAAEGAKQEVGEIRKERKRVVAELNRAETKARALIDRMAETPAGKSISVLMTRIKELDNDVVSLKERRDVLDFKIAELEKQAISADFVIAKLKEFDRLWDKLTFEQKFDIVHLLVKKVVYFENDPENSDKLRKGRIDVEFFSVFEGEEGVKKSSLRVAVTEKGFPQTPF